MAATQQSIVNKKWLEMMINSPIKKRRKATNISTDNCLAGELCWQQEEEMILDEEKVNTGRCHSCKSPCHYTCLYEKKIDGHNSELYRTKCYQSEVVQAKDASVTFAELLKSKPNSRQEKRAISIATDCKKICGQLHSSIKADNDSQQVLCLGKEKELLYSKKSKRMGGTEWGVFFRKKTWYTEVKSHTGGSYFVVW